MNIVLKAVAIVVVAIIVDSVVTNTVRLGVVVGKAIIAA